MAPGFAFASSTNSVNVRTPSDGATLTSVGASPIRDTAAKSPIGSNGKFLFNVPRIAWPELASRTV